MVVPACMNRRLLQTVLQIPTTRITSQYLPCCASPPKTWIRTITGSSTKYGSTTPGVSFGEENDGVIAPYIEKSNKKLKKQKKNKNKHTTIESAEPDVNDDYEVGGFIDRSGSTRTKAFVSRDEKLQTIGEEEVIANSNKKKRKSESTSVKIKKTLLDGSKVRNADAGFRVIKYESEGKEPLAVKRYPHTKKQTHGIDHLTLRKHDSLSIRKHRLGNGAEDGTWAEESLMDNKTAEMIKKVHRLEKKQTEDAESWAIQKNALKEKFEEGWNPRKKMSPDAMEGIRDLHEQDPAKYSTELLAQQFKMSPEAIRRILKSKWSSQLSPEKMHERRERWAKRHDRIWDAQAELGLRPPRTKDKEIEDPDKFEQDMQRRRILGDV